MARKRGKWFFIRLGAIVVVGAVAIALASLYRRSRRPKAAPDAVQRAGLKMVAEVLERIGTTDFGRSKRGQLLAETVRGFVRRGRVVFTAEIAAQALYRRELDGYQVLYVQVQRLGGRFAHQPREGVAEGLFHEAVHARQRHRGGASIDEECDGYAAGLCAGAAVEGRTPPELLTLDGVPVATFVARAYPNLSRDPDYQPIGESRQWLLKRTGLR